MHSSIVMSLLKVVLLGFVLLMMAQFTAARPQPSIESQDGPDDTNLELQKILPLINRINFRNNEDLAYLLNSYGSSSGNSLPSGWNDERLFRGPEMKRQIRYRQCYFNPISCFRK
uniref:CSON001368 protein n=1 Tax=Culicoides sonorensis TaxID=179676 RepID=A0A336MGX7_CULSO